MNPLFGASSRGLLIIETAATSGKVHPHAAQKQTRGPSTSSKKDCWCFHFRSLLKEMGFFLLSGQFLCACVAPLSCQGFPGVSAFFECLFFDFISFSFSNPYNSCRDYIPCFQKYISYGCKVA